MHELKPEFTEAHYFLMMKQIAQCPVTSEQSQDSISSSLSIAPKAASLLN